MVFAATNTMDAYWSCWTPIRRRRIPWTLVGVAGLLFAATDTMDAYWSCWTPIRRDEYHGRLLELLDAYSVSFKDPLAGSDITFTFC